MSEINEIGLSLQVLLPHLFFIRLVSLAIGATIFVHTVCMAGFMPPKKTPWDIVIPLAMAGGSGVGMAVGAAAADLATIFMCTLGATAAWGAMSISLWLRGLHVSKYFAERG